MLSDAAVDVGRRQCRTLLSERAVAFAEEKGRIINSAAARGMTRSSATEGQVDRLIVEEYQRRARLLADTYLQLAASAGARDEGAASQLKGLVADDLDANVADLAAAHEWAESILGPPGHLTPLAQARSRALDEAHAHIDFTLATSPAPAQAAANEQADLFELKPGWGGFSVNLKEALRRLKRR